MNLVSSHRAEEEASSRSGGAVLFLGIVFFLSGVPALLYQLCWQRMLYTVYGVNIESIAVVVSAFMLGLGLGSLWGGRLASVSTLPPLLAFVWLEGAIAVYGLLSPWVFREVARLTLGASLLSTGVLSFGLVVLPTLLMGASLPLLVAHLLRHSRNMGRTVGLLYFVNTLGSASACFLAVYVLFGQLGLSGTIRLAALFNVVAAGGAFVLYRSRLAYRRPGAEGISRAGRAEGGARGDVVPFAMVLVLAGVAGFISLAYEVVLARAYAFVSAGRASAFPLVLGWYLVGIALGSLVSAIYCARSRLERRQQVSVLGLYFLVVNLLGFATIPILANATRSISFEATYPLVALLAGGLGATLPLMTHIGIEPDRNAARKLSYVYLANILGSTLGSLLTGFWAMDHFGLATVVTALSILGIVLACALLVPGGGPRVRVGASALAVTSVSAILMVRGDAFKDLYEKLLWKQSYSEYDSFAHVVEGRSGVVTVTRRGLVFGGGVYDGQLSVDLVDDKNGLIRPAVLPAFHASPKRILVIGLATGAWAQLLVHHPDVERLVAIEINPGYLEVIRRSDAVKSLLKNEKFSLVIDDGRRWLARHRERRFDVIVMNTTYHWRAHAANLLSRDFLSELSDHLNPGGIVLYNTTSSPEAQRTGALAFEHSLRFANNLLVSNAPLVPDEDRLRRILTEYEIDGEPIFDLQDPRHEQRLEEIVGVLDEFTTSPKAIGFEKRADLLARTRGARIITDDNMGTEWTYRGFED